MNNIDIDSSELKLHAKNMYYTLRRIRLRGRETCEHCQNPITNHLACVEEIEHGYILMCFCNMDCYLHRKHAEKMHRVHTLIRVRGRETCYNQECANIIMNLKTCIQDIDFGCGGPRDKYTVYYCCRECYGYPID